MERDVEAAKVPLYDRGEQIRMLAPIAPGPFTREENLAGR